MSDVFECVHGTPIRMDCWKCRGATEIEVAAMLSSALARALKAEERAQVAETALRKINDIRNSIVGFQSINWSEHIYPLVAALNEAGIKGMEYPEGKQNFGTLLERTNKAEEQRDALLAVCKAILTAYKDSEEAFRRAGIPYQQSSVVVNFGSQLREAIRQTEPEFKLEDGRGK